MRTAVFVAPFFAETTLRFVDAAASLPNVRLALISQDPAERIPAATRAKLAAHCRIDAGLDPSAIARAVREIGARLGDPSRVVGALEQLQVPLAKVREELGIPGMQVEAARNFRDKARMKDVLRAAGVPCARHCLARTVGEVWSFVEEVGFPVVIKPPSGAGARDTFRVESGDALRDLLRQVTFREADTVLVEEFVVGEEHSFDTVSLKGQPMWHSLTHYSPGCLDVMRNPWIQWTVLLPREVDHPRYDDIRAVGVRALAALGMGTGLSHLEWFRRPDDTIAVSEVAARPPGAQFTTLISWAHDVDFYKLWARLVVLEEFDRPARPFAAGIAFLRGQGRGSVRRIRGLQQAHAEMGDLVAEVRLPKPGQLPASSYEGDGWVVLRHPETGVVAAALERLVQIVRVELG